MPIGQLAIASQRVPVNSRAPDGGACSSRQPPPAQVGSLKQPAGMGAEAKIDPSHTASNAPPGGIKNTGGTAQSAAQAQDPFWSATQVCAQDPSCQVSG